MGDRILKYLILITNFVIVLFLLFLLNIYYGKSEWGCEGDLYYVTVGLVGFFSFVTFFIIFIFVLPIPFYFFSGSITYRQLSVSISRLTFLDILDILKRFNIDDLCDFFKYLLMKFLIKIEVYIPNIKFIGFIFVNVLGYFSIFHFLYFLVVFFYHFFPVLVSFIYNFFCLIVILFVFIFDLFILYFGNFANPLNGFTGSVIIWTLFFLILLPELIDFFMESLKGRDIWVEETVESFEVAKLQFRLFLYDFYIGKVYNLFFFSLYPFLLIFFGLYGIFSLIFIAKKDYRMQYWYFKKLDPFSSCNFKPIFFSDYFLMVISAVVGIFDYYFGRLCYSIWIFLQVFFRLCIFSVFYVFVYFFFFFFFMPLIFWFLLFSVLITRFIIFAFKFSIFLSPLMGKTFFMIFFFNFVFNFINFFKSVFLFSYLYCRFYQNFFFLIYRYVLYLILVFVLFFLPLVFFIYDIFFSQSGASFLVIASSLLVLLVFLFGNLILISICFCYFFFHFLFFTLKAFFSNILFNSGSSSYKIKDQNYFIMGNHKIFSYKGFYFSLVKFIRSLNIDQVYILYYSFVLHKHVRPFYLLFNNFLYICILVFVIFPIIFYSVGLFYMRYVDQATTPQTYELQFYRLRLWKRYYRPRKTRNIEQYPYFSYQGFFTDTNYSKLPPWLNYWIYDKVLFDGSWSVTILVYFFSRFAILPWVNWQIGPKPKYKYKPEALVIEPFFLEASISYRYHFLYFMGIFPLLVSLLLFFVFDDYMLGCCDEIDFNYGFNPFPASQPIFNNYQEVLIVSYKDSACAGYIEDESTFYEEDDDLDELMEDDLLFEFLLDIYELAMITDYENYIQTMDFYNELTSDLIFEVAPFKKFFESPGLVMDSGHDYFTFDETDDEDSEYFVDVSEDLHHNFFESQEFVMLLSNYIIRDFIIHDKIHKHRTRFHANTFSGLFTIEYNDNAGLDQALHTLDEHPNSGIFNSYYKDYAERGFNFIKKNVPIYYDYVSVKFYLSMRFEYGNEMFDLFRNGFFFFINYIYFESLVGISILKHFGLLNYKKDFNVFLSFFNFFFDYSRKKNLNFFSANFDFFYLFYMSYKNCKVYFKGSTLERHGSNLKRKKFNSFLYKKLYLGLSSSFFSKVFNIFPEQNKAFVSKFYNMNDKIEYFFTNKYFLFTKDFLYIWSFFVLNNPTEIRTYDCYSFINDRYHSEFKKAFFKNIFWKVPYTVPPFLHDVPDYSFNHDMLFDSYFAYEDELSMYGVVRKDERQHSFPRMLGLKKQFHNIRVSDRSFDGLLSKRDFFCKLKKNNFSFTKYAFFFRTNLSFFKLINLNYLNKKRILKNILKLKKINKKVKVLQKSLMYFKKLFYLRNNDFRFRKRSLFQRNLKNLFSSQDPFPFAKEDTELEKLILKAKKKFDLKYYKRGLSKDDIIAPYVLDILLSGVLRRNFINLKKNSRFGLKLKKKSLLSDLKKTFAFNNNQIGSSVPRFYDKSFFGLFKGKNKRFGKVKFYLQKLSYYGFFFQSPLKKNLRYQGFYPKSQFTLNLIKKDNFALNNNNKFTNKIKILLCGPNYQSFFKFVSHLEKRKFELDFFFSCFMINLKKYISLSEEIERKKKSGEDYKADLDVFMDGQSRFLDIFASINNKGRLRGNVEESKFLHQVYENFFLCDSLKCKYYNNKRLGNKNVVLYPDRQNMRRLKDIFPFSLGCDGNDNNLFFLNFKDLNRFKIFYSLITNSAKLKKSENLSDILSSYSLKKKTFIRLNNLLKLKKVDSYFTGAHSRSKVKQKKSDYLNLNRNTVRNSFNISHTVFDSAKKSRKFNFNFLLLKILTSRDFSFYKSFAFDSFLSLEDSSVFEFASAFFFSTDSFFFNDFSEKIFDIENKNFSVDLLKDRIKVLNSQYIYLYKLYLDFEVEISEARSNLEYLNILKWRKYGSNLRRFSIISRKLQNILLKLAWYNIIIKYPDRVHSSVLVKFLTFLQYMLSNFFKRRLSYSPTYIKLYHNAFLIPLSEAIHGGDQMVNDFTKFVFGKDAAFLEDYVMTEDHFANFRVYHAYSTQEETFLYMNLGFQGALMEEFYYSYNNFLLNFESADSKLNELKSSGAPNYFKNYYINKLYLAIYSFVFRFISKIVSFRYFRLIFIHLFSLPDLSFNKLDAQKESESENLENQDASELEKKPRVSKQVADWLKEADTIVELQKESEKKKKL